MAIEKIEYQNKVAIDDVGVPEKNKITAENMNEIKEVVNNNADNFDETAAAINERIDTANSAINNIVENTYTKTETDEKLAQKADISDIPDVSGFITKDVNDLTNYTVKTSTGSLIDLEINQSNYVVSLSLKDIDGNVISSDNIDLPLESVVVGGSYDAVNKKIVLTLENGNTVDIPVGDLIAGLQTEITSQNKLASDLVDDTNSGNKFVTTTEKNTWNAKYDKPSGGIPKTDLASDVQTSLGKADTAIQSSDLTNYVTNTDYATAEIGGTIRTSNASGLGISNGNLYAVTKAYNTYNSASDNMFIGKGTLENVITGKNLETSNNKVTSISSSSTNTEYPSAKCVHDSQATQDDEIEALQTENERLKATLPTTTGSGEEVTLEKTAELDFVKPPLPRGNSEQEGEPSPDNEVPITNVTGNVEVTISNENNTESKTLSVSLGNIELCKLGNYQDYLYKNNGKWYKHNAIKKLVLNGRENWSISNNVFYLASISDYINSSGKICLSDKYTAINNTDVGTVAITQNNSICFFATNTNPRLYIRDERFNNVNAFKAELSENNVKVYYPTVTPTDTEITDATLISQLEEISKTLSYQGQTNITSNTIALFDVEAYQDLKIILEDLDLTKLSTFDSTKTQVLKNINGTLTWVDE